MPPFLSALAARLSITGIIIAVLALLLMVQTVRIEGFSVWPVHVHGLRERLKASEAGRSTDRARYEQAQKDAAAKNQEQVRVIEKRQEEVTDEVTRNLNTRLERLRRELRPQSPPASGVAGSPSTGAAGKAKPGTDEAPRLCLTPEELLRGAEGEERHDRLIDWVEKQLAVPR